MNDFKDYLAHHGILGMKWGVRRFRNYDGSLTNAGRKRYDSPGNLRYKKTAKEQEARKEKRRTRAKQIAKGLAAAALVGGAGYAAYKLSKKAFGGPSKAGHDPITQAFRESRGEDPMSKWMKWKNGLETRGGDDDKYYKDTTDNMDAGLPFYVKDKNGKPKLVSDPEEIKRLRDEFNEITEKRAAEWRAKAGYTDDPIKEPERVTVKRVEPDRVPKRSAEAEAAKTREFVFIASRQGDPEDSLRALREHPDLNTPGSRDFLQERFKSRLKERQSEPIFRDDGLMHISRIDSGESVMTKSSWNAEKAGKRKPGHFEKQNDGLTMSAYEALVRKYADPYLAYRAKHPETYGLQTNEDPAYFYEEWDI